MTLTRRTLAGSALAASALALAPAAAPQARPRSPGVVISRGGAAGGWPAGSRGAYDQAANDGADLLECAVVPTKDGVLIARQDNELSGDTDIAARAEYAERRATRVIGGATREGWFSEDFTLAELKSLTLIAAGRGPPKGERPVILTLDELMKLAQGACVRTTRVVGLYISLWAPRYFASLDLAVEQPLATVIRSQGYNSPASALWLAAEDAASLKALADLTRVRRVWRVQAPADAAALVADPAGTSAAAAAIALPAAWLLDAATPRALHAAALLDAIHSAGLAAHGWLASGEVFPPAPLRPGDARRALAALYAGGIDGVCGELAAPLARARADVFRPSGEG